MWCYSFNYFFPLLYMRQFLFLIIVYSTCGTWYTITLMMRRHDTHTHTQNSVELYYIYMREYSECAKPNQKNSWLMATFSVQTTGNATDPALYPFGIWFIYHRWNRFITWRNQRFRTGLLPDRGSSGFRYRYVYVRFLLIGMIYRSIYWNLSILRFIAGSRADDISLPIEELESPIGTISSWDSHINYRHHMNQAPLAWGVALHCNAKHFKSRTGIVRILLVVSGNDSIVPLNHVARCTLQLIFQFQFHLAIIILMNWPNLISLLISVSHKLKLSSAACLITECSAGTVQVGLFLLPLLGRLRLMMFSALFSILITCLLIFLDVSAIALMFPFNWGKVVSQPAYLSLSLCFSLTFFAFWHHSTIYYSLIFPLVCSSFGSVAHSPIFLVL